MVFTKLILIICCISLVISLHILERKTTLTISMTLKPPSVHVGYHDQLLYQFSLLLDVEIRLWSFRLLLRMSSSWSFPIKALNSPRIRSLKSAFGW